MALTEERRATLKAYCRLDGLTAEEEVLLEVLYGSAVQYMAQAGVRAPEANTARAAQYDTVVNALVLDAWDARGSQVSGITLNENPAFRRLINQLKFTEPVSNSDTGTGV